MNSICLVFSSLEMQRHIQAKVLTFNFYHKLSADAFFVAGLMWKGKFLLIFFQTCYIFVDVMSGVYTEETLQPVNKTDH